MKLALDKIVIDPSIYPRTRVNLFHVNKLRSALSAGAVFPPLVVERETHRLVDGLHRHGAYKAEGIATVDVVAKKYASEAELFADAVRLNVGHGEPLDQYTVRSAIIRLTEYGFAREQIIEIVRLPPVKLDEIQRGFAYNAENNKPMALKGGLDHMAGARLDPEQQEVNRHYSGQKATFYVRQLCGLLEADMWPVKSENFTHEMDRLVTLWEQIKHGRAAPDVAA